MEKMQTYFYRDMSDTLQDLKGRGCNSDNAILALSLRNMLKPIFGICPKVEQTTLGELNAATFSIFNEAEGFWIHFGLHTVENNFDSMDNGDIEAIIQIIYEFKVNPEIVKTSGRYIFRSVLARRADGVITIDKEALNDLAISIAKSLEKAKNDLNIKGE